MSKNHGTGWWACDLDGTLAVYDKFISPEHIGAPIMRTVRRVRHWLRQGRHVRIFTARVHPSGGLESVTAREAIEAFCFKHFGRTLPVVCEKDYHMVQLLDDRALQCYPNTGELVQERLRKAEAELALYGVIYDAVEGYYRREG